MNRILGIDSSTQGVAWTLVVGGKPTKWGKIQLAKTIGMNNKLKKIAEEFPQVLADTKPDYIAIERVIFVRSAATARVLAYVVGALMTLLLKEGYDCEDVDISSWKQFGGYHNITRKFVLMATKKLGRLPAKKLCEQLRKSQTQRVLKHNFPKFDGVEDNDISDSCMIGLYMYNKKCKPFALKKSKEIALDLDELARLGLDNIL